MPAPGGTMDDSAQRACRAVGQQIVIYARSGKWWVQPLVSHPFTALQPGAKWTNATHLGSEYAALLAGARCAQQPRRVQPL